jgi:hypothetical protein
MARHVIESVLVGPTGTIVQDKSGQRWLPSGQHLVAVCRCSGIRRT